MTTMAGWLTGRVDGNRIHIRRSFNGSEWEFAEKQLRNGLQQLGMDSANIDEILAGINCSGQYANRLDLQGQRGQLQVVLLKVQSAWDQKREHVDVDLVAASYHQHLSLSWAWHFSSSRQAILQRLHRLSI